MLTLVTPNTTLPVLAQDIKDQLSIDGTCHDAKVQDYILSARDLLERKLDRPLLPSTYKLVERCFPHRLPKPPLQSVTSITYFDVNNVEQTMVQGTDYRVHKATDNYGFIEYVNCPPSLYCRMDAVTVEFVAGWPEVPPCVKQAIRLYVDTWFNNRSGELVGLTSKKLELGIDDILSVLNWGLYR